MEWDGIGMGMGTGMNGPHRSVASFYHLFLL
jgi:hypothetical protein